ncbi:MAG: hypothetical protein K0R29_1145 [Pseudobdellovibrio sp.]|nr:hypothetical protein [Pseudobdellovibrio sp.]
MKLISKTALLFIVLTFSLSGFAAGLLNYSNAVKLNQYKGQTFFSLMEDVIKPQLDQKAIQGFDIASGSKLVAGLQKVDKKVAASAIRAAGNVGALKMAGNSLSASSRNITFKQLPSALAREGVGPGRYDLTTYISLISEGGVAVEIDANNIAYNVNYGTGQDENDERTGRSFGESFDRLALDASDKHYLKTLEAYVKADQANVRYFYLSLMEILLNNDSSNFKKISRPGQAVATDFIAVYTAEQDRHLMSNLTRHPWDASLLEVTMLSAFHAGQRKIKLIVNGEFTDTTLKQAPGCSTATRSSQRASLIDYWQFSSSDDPENCNRSGLNITRRDFRKLGRIITAYQKRMNPELVANVQRHFRTNKNRNNVFAQLSDFLINYDTPKKLNANTLELSKDFTNFLMQIKADANQTDQFITENLKSEEFTESDEN